jgi:hypothetical protein
MQAKSMPVLFAAALLAGAAGEGRAEGILFLQRCEGGCQFQAGADDSGTNHSSVINGTRNLTAAPQSEATWDSMVECVRDTFAPFAIAVTEVDPGTVEHFELAIAGTPQQLGYANSTVNVAPSTCNGDGVVPNSIGFVLAGQFGEVPLELCWYAAQTLGVIFGLDNAVLETDVMTYIGGPLPKTFVDESSACGEFSPRTCRCGGTTQNSYQRVLTVLPEPGVAASGPAAALAIAALARRRYRKIG